MPFRFFGGRRREASAPEPVAPQQLSLAQLRAALNSLPLGVVIMSGDRAMRWSNEAYESLVPPSSADAETFDVALGSMLEDAFDGLTSEVHLEFGEPAVRMLELTGVPISDGGALVLVYDETKQVMSDRVRTDFVANISHELRTPIGAISLMAENLMLEAAGTDVERMASVILSEVTRLNDTIGDLLELARIEFDGLSHTQDVEVARIIEEAVGRLRTAALAKSVMLSIDNFPAITVRGDRAQLVSAIGNLIDNAIKFSSKGSIVHVSTSVEGDRASIVVADSGPGIAPEHMNRIFERFYRVDDARSRATGGSGLGLAIVRHIALLHGGEVSVESTVGEGSRFRLEIPLGPASIAKSDEPIPS